MGGGEDGRARRLRRRDDVPRRPHAAHLRDRAGRPGAWSVVRPQAHFATSWFLVSVVSHAMRASAQMIEADKLQVKELRQQGYHDNQLREQGFPNVALGLAPAVLKK